MNTDKNYTYLLSILIISIIILSCTTHNSSRPPYPPSKVIEKISWHEDTFMSAAPGSDIWPVTWGPDDKIYTAWGDGGGFSGDNKNGRVSMGFASIEGEPTNYKARNLNGGAQSKFPPTWKCKDCGKTAGLLYVNGTLYAWINKQNDPWPNVDFTLVWSDDFAKSWHQANWIFPAGEDNFKPGAFINYGKDYIDGGKYIYFYGKKQNLETKTYLGRATRSEIKNKQKYEYFAGLDNQNNPRWTNDLYEMKPMFSDSNGGGGHIVYNHALKRYINAGSRGAGGELAIFDAPNPWGPWTTVAYYDNWLNANGGHSLAYNFVNKWTSSDGLTMWMIFSFNKGNEKYHDRFNLIKATLTLKNNTQP